MKHLEKLAMLAALADIGISPEAFENLELSVKITTEMESEQVRVKRTYEYYIKKN